MLEIASTNSPIGSTIFSVIALSTISFIVLAILRYYLPLRTTPAFYLVPIFFALWLPTIVVVLVPIDLASTATTGDEATRGIWLPERVILVSWRITYWLTFVLTWFILPILAEYSDAGYREPKDKFMYSIRQNAQFLAMVGVAGVVGFVYVTISYGLSLDVLRSLVMSLSYIVGMVMAIYLMGHGLVSIPRRLIRNASITGRLRRLQTKAPKVYEHMEDSLVSLEEIEYQVSELSRRKVGSAMHFQDWIEELQEIAGVSEHQARPGTTDPNSRVVPTVITEKYLADITRRLVRARHTRSRYVDDWHRLVQSAHETQMILDSAGSKRLDFGEPDPHAGSWEKTRILSPYTRYLVYYYFIPYTEVLLGIFLGAASACIVWSEVVKLAMPKLSVIRLTVIHHWVQDKAQVGFAGQVIAAFWICYMCAATLISMTEVKTWRGRALVKRNTAYEPAFWYSLQVAKLSIPISYNFLTFLSERVYEKTVYHQFLGKFINLTRLGDWFDDLYPMFILFPVFATLFGLYGRVKRIFVGMDIIEDEEDNPTGYGTGSWREGRDLIERELRGNSLSRRDDAFTRLGAAVGNPGHRAAPVLSIPAARNAASSPARSPARAPARTGRTGQSSRPTPHLDEPEDENIFSIIGHRMKNTIDNIETPQWVQDFGQGKKPKWMGGDDHQGQSSGGQSSGQGSNANSDIRRWFGGEGNIRL